MLLSVIFLFSIHCFFMTSSLIRQYKPTCNYSRISSLYLKIDPFQPELKRKTLSFLIKNQLSCKLWWYIKMWNCNLSSCLSKLHLNRPFTWSGHMVENKLHWDATGTCTTPARLSFVLKVPLRNLLPSPVPSAMWPDRAKGLLPASIHVLKH